MQTESTITIQHKIKPDYQLIPGDVLQIDHEFVKVLRSEYNPETKTTTITVIRGTSDKE